MTALSPLADAWTRFWHTPGDPRVAALLRILIGAITVLMYGLQAPWVQTWWGPDGLMPGRLARRLLAADRSSVLLLLPDDPTVLWICWSIVLVQAVLLMVGWYSHVQAACLFVWHVSFQHRNLVILDGEDAVLRLITFLLIFAPIAQRWSLDARAGRAREVRSGWALRLIQVQIVFVFAMAGLEKWPGASWRYGNALHFIFHLDDFYPKVALPQVLVDWPWTSRLMSWGTLVLEAVVPIAVWIPRLRRPTVLVAIAFHLSLELLMNLYFFQWLMITGWLSFLRWDEDVAWLRARLGWRATG